MRLKFVQLLFHLNAVYISTHIINTRLGQLEGATKVARNNKLYNSYSRIPYAKPPIGDLRFKPPVSSNKWKGTLDATQITPNCPQIKDSTYNGTEDCLYLNIYTPKDAKPGSNYPVIFYIFGGINKNGGVTKLGPQNFMGRDIIMVFVSYRLGVLGFLSTGDSVIPGNMGLKDQTLGLRWAKENIYDFGGDPNRITLQGHSSGSVCVHLHTLSPLSKDYFHRAIMQSGSSVSPNTFADKDVAMGLTKVLCDRLHCPVNSSETMFNCMNGKTAEELVEAANTLQIWLSEPQNIFRPTTEDDVEGAFLSQHPVLAPYQSDEKAWLLGITNKEGASYVGSEPDGVTARRILAGHSKLYLPVKATFKWTTKPNHIDYIEQILRTHFFGDEKSGSAADDALVELLSGIMHGMALVQDVEKYRGSKYVYLYNYRGGYSNQGSSVFRGVAHADELALLFVRGDKGVTEKDLEFGDEIITRWVNFAHSGDPNTPFAINKSVFSVWKPVSSKRLEYLVIKQNGTMEAGHLVDRFRFWKHIPIFGKYL